MAWNGWRGASKRNMPRSCAIGNSMPANSVRAGAVPDPLPLFPLQTVLFPGALLWLKVFEARYLDLVSEALRDKQPFGVVCLKQGSEVGHAAKLVELEEVGVLARLDDVDAEQPGILRV